MVERTRGRTMQLLHETASQQDVCPNETTRLTAAFQLFLVSSILLRTSGPSADPFRIRCDSILFHRLLSSSNSSIHGHTGSADPPGCALV